MELAISFLTACLFTVAISFGYGRKLTELDAGRPVLGAVGFLIVIAGYSWYRRDFDLFTDLVMWFIIVCLPVLLAGVINTLLESERGKAAHQAELEALRAQAEKKAIARELEVYSVINDD